ncbi:MAG: 30S ribosomal protein S5 [Deltaproteobacteria bacterium GWA2_38_16]|nr:MAG: 30S ribosomal protein S5 [Deltaproteobacteria bacterium GWA2_38_16]OGQ03798.1 MAG: 30S ribosomal protein S5 [Deltaproteobacteria bacterium RIFCSPHIGHO2_02_FULL_38_15]OGQ34308.1 MAG: 30S ribosomal protein S5 [Deltaproteobacteria bacterium RIFCSPLOWO2_01_FULL_38_9]OGQ59147.1 MAG: 30S ribosomal protein S5 [Deltaproteobacteria bacterium RIFCSPLOWO2_12_FULL_38_8]
MAILRTGTEKKIEKKESEFTEKIVSINRCTKVVKGGRRLSFAALVVLGDKKGRVGIGLGKDDEVPEAIRKAQDQAKKNFMTVPMLNKTIPQEVMGKFGSGLVLLKPAVEGTGLIAGSAVRAVLECAGIQDILTKSLGASNPHNVLKATLAALKKLRSREEYAELRGKTSKEI